MPGSAYPRPHAQLATRPARTDALIWARFGGVYDRRPKRRTGPWPDLAAQLLTHLPRAFNDGACWSPAAYPYGAPRGNRFVEALDALVLEFDGAAPDLAPLEAAGVTYLVHSTFSHYLVDARHPVAAPHYRLVCPLAVPVPAAPWRPLYAGARAFFPEADPACSDPARMQRFPACPLVPPVPPETRLVDTGRWLDPNSLPPPPPRPHRPPRPWPAAPGEFTPGADWRVAAREVNARLRIVDVMVRDGWVDLGEHNGCTHVGRPGKDYSLPDSRCSATADYLGNNRAYIFSSNALPLEAGQTYSVFEYLCVTHYGGDVHRAAQDLRRRGYGG